MSPIHPTIGAIDNGGNTSNSTAERTTRCSRCQESGQSATTRRNDLALQELSHHLGNKSTAHLVMSEPGTGNNNQVPSMSYKDIKQIMRHRLAQYKKGILSARDIQVIVKDWEDERKEGELDQKIIEKEVEKLKKKIKEYNLAMI